jgi:hypothetical protein
MASGSGPPGPDPTDAGGDGNLAGAVTDFPAGEDGDGWGPVSHPVYKDKTECITICMPGSSSIHIVTSSVKNQQQYHEKRI